MIVLTLQMRKLRSGGRQGLAQGPIEGAVEQNTNVTVEPLFLVWGVWARSGGRAGGSPVYLGPSYARLWARHGA